MATAPQELLERLVRDITATMGEDLLGLYVHGSYTAGDFDVERSDLDLLAVLAIDPTDSTLDVLGPMHQEIVAENPAWADRIEVEYVSVQALSDFRTEPHPMILISPGEPIHLVSATDHYVLNWHAARTRGIALRGPAPAELIPVITEEEFRQAVIRHAAQWPQWVRGSHAVGAQAYAVLTVCRALQSIRENRNVSKRQASSYGIENLPEWAELIRWAECWWYRGGSDSEPGRLAEVIRFVDETTERINVDGHDRGGPSRP